MTGRSEDERQAMDRLAVQLLRDFWLTTVTAFVDAVGERKAMKAALPYLKPFGMSDALELRDAGGITDNGIGGELQTLTLSMDVIGVMHEGAEMRADGGLIEVTDCPLKGAPRMICLLHEEIGRGMLSAKGKDLEMKNLGVKEGERKTCRWLIYDATKGVDAVMRQGASSSIALVEIDEDTRLDMAMVSLTDSWMTTLSAMSDALGEDKAELVLAPRFRAIGSNLARELQQLAGTEESSPAAIAKVVDKFNQVLYQEGDLILVEESPPVKVMSSCPFSGASSLACHMVESVIKGICQQIDEGSDCRFVRLECRDNVVCHWAIVRRQRPSWPSKDERNGKK